MPFAIIDVNGGFSVCEIHVRCTGIGLLDHQRIVEFRTHVSGYPWTNVGPRIPATVVTTDRIFETASGAIEAAMSLMTVRQGAIQAHLERLAADFAWERHFESEGITWERRQTAAQEMLEQAGLEREERFARKLASERIIIVNEEPSRPSAWERVNRDESEDP